MILLLILLVTTERKKKSRVHKLQRGEFQESVAVKGILNLVRYKIQQIKKNSKEEMNIGRRVSAATKMAAAEQLYDSYLKPLMEEEIRNSNLSYSKIAARVEEKTREERKEVEKEIRKVAVEEREQQQRDLKDF